MTSQNVYYECMVEDCKKVLIYTSKDVFMPFCGEHFSTYRNYNHKDVPVVISYEEALSRENRKSTKDATTILINNSY